MAQGERIWGSFSSEEWAANQAVDWVASVKNGDAEAFEALFVAYMPLLRHMVCSFQDSFAATAFSQEDLLQEAAFCLYQAALRFCQHSGVTFVAFAKRCIYNRFVSLLRRTKRDISQIGLEALDQVSADPAAACFYGEQVEARICMTDCMSSLETKVLRYYLRGYSYDEIARLLGKNEKAVDNAMARVRRKLRSEAVTDRE